ncbi:MAG: hypothetical protein H7Y18_04585 [Clostridiaceae bacterium]|nr:hypothetical protein [Clostridiaceae bacterium]
MNKMCIFDSKKTCNECGECMICDLNRNKKCDNCGICLETAGVDMKEVEIDEIIDEVEEMEVDQAIPVIEEEILPEEETADFELIDDIAGLGDIIEDLKIGGNSEKLSYTEEYPGLILKKK